MAWQTEIANRFADTGFWRFTAAAAIALIGIALAGWCWLQFADRLLELVALDGANRALANELLSPDALMRRVMLRTMRS